MSGGLFYRASTNFGKYLKDFQEKGSVYMLPRQRLQDSEWKALNQQLAQHGVRLVPAEKNGVSYMTFSSLSKQQGREKEMVAQLRSRASRNFDKYLRAFLERDEAYMLPRERMTDEMWRELNKSLVSHGVRLVPVEKDGVSYMMFSALSKQRAGTKETDPVLDSILGEYKVHKIKRGVVPAFIYDRPGLGEGQAQAKADEIMAAGKHYATVLSKTGGGSGSDHIVVAIKKYDAENNLGAVWDGERLIRHLDSKGNKRYIQALVGYPLTHINKTPVTIESIDDYGATSKRAILVVNVGGKKLPFYISTGSAGKTEVPTGKWEFFGGITPDGWFRKGTLKDIVSHYNSPELKQIADALDGKIGDVRDAVDILKSAGREYLGGQGDVAYALEVPRISTERINRDVFNPENDKIFYLDLKEIKDYLSSLSVTRNEFKKVSSEFKQGAKRIDDMIARIKQAASEFKQGAKSICKKLVGFLKDGKSNS